MVETSSNEGGEEFRRVSDVASGSADEQLFRVLHTTRLPREIFFTNIRAEQVTQVQWLLRRDQILQSWSLAQFYWDEQAPLGTFVKTFAPGRLIEIADSMQSNPITRATPL